MYPNKLINFLNPGWLGEENVETNLCRFLDGRTNKAHYSLIPAQFHFIKRHRL